MRTEKGPLEVVSEDMSVFRKVVSVKRVEWVQLRPWSQVTPGGMLVETSASHTTSEPQFPHL